LGEAGLATQIANEYIKRSDRSDLLNIDKIEFVRTVAQDLPLADSLAKEFKSRVLDHLNDNQLCTDKILTFLATYINFAHSGDNFFKLCYAEPEKVDSAVHYKGVAGYWLDKMITKDEIIDRIAIHPDAKSGEPRWREMDRSISIKFPKVNGRQLVMDYEIEYYKRQKRWPVFSNLLIERVEKYGVFDELFGNPAIPSETDFNLNNLAWLLFCHTSSPRELRVALLWSDSAVRLCKDSNKPNWIDTKANILYKLGEKQKAVVLEKGAIALDPGNDGFRNNLRKMLRGRPTWPQ